MVHFLAYGDKADPNSVLRRSRPPTTAQRRERHHIERSVTTKNVLKLNEIVDVGVRMCVRVNQKTLDIVSKTNKVEIVFVTTYVGSS